MRVTISGEAGSGKSVVGKLVAEKLGLKHYSMGDMMKRMAAEKGMTLPEFNKLGEKDESIDKSIDKFQTELGKKEDDFVIDGRLSFLFIPSAIKIFLDADLRTRAMRILNDNREEEKYSTVDDAMQQLEKRHESDRKRYVEYYGVDCYTKSFYDIVIDTTNLSIEEVADEVIERIKKFK